MKKYASVLAVFLMCSMAAFAQDDDDWASKSYQIDSFSRIYLHGGFRVFLTQGDVQALTVKTSNNDVFENLTVENRGQQLRLEMERDFITYKRIRLYITFTNLNEIIAEGGLKLLSDGYLDLDDLYLHIEGGASVQLQMKAEDVDLSGEGGILVDLDGVANRLDVALSGAGHVNAVELKTKEASVEIEGVGTSSVYATEKLFAKIEGVGKVSYKGEPEVVQTINGLGTVRKY